MMEAVAEEVGMNKGDFGQRHPRGRNEKGH